ncbi:Helicase associated domain protein [Streptomyces sp. NPDC091272]|uniref:DEAD/DEAH box helicase n=1 Tax=Streptomyces sp. NPDC091272 TaxID=3365981 RepID=UPI0038215F1A
MLNQALRAHQVEAVDAVVRHLQAPVGAPVPAGGLRCQVIAATGSGKTRIAAVVAQRLRARRVLVLVPTLDLLMQMAAEWRRAGRTGATVGACSLSASVSEGLPCTTNPMELVSWVQGQGPVTVFSTYSSASTTVHQARAMGMDGFDLMVVDEAHRTSGDAAKAWAAVHDQTKIPAVRRLYMTATPRIWEALEDSRKQGRSAPRLIASMDDGSPVFGPVAWKLTLSQAISRGLVAPYQIICVDISDPDLHAAHAAGDRSSDHVRGARLAALQAGLVTAAADENLRKTLAFHSRVHEAEAMAAGLPEVAERLFAQDPARYHPPERVWADWLCGEHKPGHRRQVLEEFESDVISCPQGTGRRRKDVVHPAKLKVLSSVRILGEGVDSARCDSVVFCDTRGSMVDIVQMVGRALRMHPGGGKIASLVVPVFLEPGETPGEMLTSPGTEALAKVLGALRSHDADAIEALADPRVRSGSWDTAGTAEAGEEEGQERRDTATGPGTGARELLRFSAPRDPAEVARFVALRVLHPETDFWRAGIAAAVRYRQEAGVEELRVPYDFVTPDGWVMGGFPLGTWLRNQRTAYRADTLVSGRVRELEKLGVVWSHRDRAFEEGLAVARHWAGEHGHLLPPATAVRNGYPIGTWAKNLRTAARLADMRAAQLEGDELPEDAERAGGLSWARREALDEIDPGWCPVWDAGWQRCLRLVQHHLKVGGAVPREAGKVVVQGEDLGRWVQGCRFG